MNKIINLTINFALSYHHHQQSVGLTMTALCYGLRIMVFQTGRFRAPACLVSRLKPLHFKFLLTTFLNLRRGRPWFLAPELNWKYRSCLGSLSASIQQLKNSNFCCVELWNLVCGVDNKVPQFHTTKVRAFEQLYNRMSALG